MNQEISYVISVSPQTGCFRHIRIAADAALSQLHQAIVNAFAYSDNQTYAFFVSGKDAASEQVKLHELNLEKGSKFKYTFGEELVFQCKMLREIAEVTEQPTVIRTKGDAPELPAAVQTEELVETAVEETPTEPEKSAKPTPRVVYTGRFDPILQARMQQRRAAQTAAEPQEMPKKIGRNDPCPCGSGKKYKKCCGR